MPEASSSGRAFTVEQKAAVIRVRRCKPTAFYDILGLESVRTSCSEGEIKKAYRKLSLLTHPDKNGYTGADEAFKMVSRAFQILSDSDKRSRYDRFGGDPDNRFSAAASGASPFDGFAQRRSAGGAGPQAQAFEADISPEELFRQFFGGGGFGGGPFGGPFGGMGGPGFVFNMGGGPGIRVHQFGGAGPQRRPHNHADAQPRSIWQAMSALLPLLLLFLVPMLSSLFTSAGSGGPTIRLDRAVSPHTQLHTSQRLSVPYWVNPADVQDFSAKKWKDLDKAAENRHISQLSQECEWEQNTRNRMMQDAMGFFWTDQVALNEARQRELPSCRKLQSYGIRTI